MTTTCRDTSAFFKDLTSLLTGQLVLPEDAAYEQCANFGVGRSTNIQQRSFAVPMRKLSFTLFAGRARVGLRSPFVVGDMITRDELCAEMAS